MAVDKLDGERGFAWIANISQSVTAEWLSGVVHVVAVRERGGGGALAVTIRSEDLPGQDLGGRGRMRPYQQIGCRQWRLSVAWMAAAFGERAWEAAHTTIAG